MHEDDLITLLLIMVFVIGALLYVAGLSFMFKSF